MDMSLIHTLRVTALFELCSWLGRMSNFDSAFDSAGRFTTALAMRSLSRTMLLWKSGHMQTLVVASEWPRDPKTDASQSLCLSKLQQEI